MIYFVRLIRFVWSLTWLLALLVGLPAGLIAVAGWPLPSRLPDQVTVQRWLIHPITTAVVLDVAACAGWLLWVWLLYTVALDVVTRIAGIRPPALRVPNPLHAATSGLVGAVVLGFSGAAANATPPAPSPPAGGLPTDVAATAAHLDVTQSNATPTTAATHDSADDAADGAWQVVDGGVLLRGGEWMPLPLAAAVAATAALVWTRRRRDYQPRPPSGHHRDDADLQPLPATVVVLQHAAASLADDPPAEASQSTALRLLQLADLPSGGVALVGPGADGAGRGLLVATLLQDRSGSAATVVTTVACLRRLVAAPQAATSTVAALRAFADLGAAVASADIADSTAATRPVLIASAADLPAGYAIPAQAQGLRVVLFGAHPSLQVWHVDPDGRVCLATTPPTVYGRLCVLTASATADILGLLSAAEPAPTEPNPLSTDPSLLTVFDGPPVPHARGVPASNHPTQRAAVYHFRALGSVTITGPDGEPVWIQRSAGRHILVLLAVYRSGATGRDLAATVWPQVPIHAATRRLHTTMSVLRSAVRVGGDVIVRDGDRYRLDPARVAVDLWQLWDAADRAAAAPDPQARRHMLREVAAAYTGDLAADLDAPWVTRHREAARRLVIDALALQADEERDTTAALRLLHQAIDHDPINTDLHRRVMRLQATTGDTAGVAHTLAALTRRLADRGTEPDEQTRQLAADLLGDTGLERPCKQL